ncbi:MAG TPA: aminotransferase class I/II-fold pyridoxal phosphate-dependent enzyme [Gemmataceae bacterium]|nr:aminotransferase class I/II-fold pyridoxal phosphate-dependent enzyme [Gemmataceae bacterium]
MKDNWIAERMGTIEISGIRKIFALGRTLKNAVDLSIGQPDFDVPEPIKQAAIDAIKSGENGYTASPGIPKLRERILADLRSQYDHEDRDVLITSGTSGALLLALSATVNPGDEVILFDPYFVSYKHLTRFVGGIPVLVDTYPHFQIDIADLEAAITPRTKAILLNSPSNPTGTVYSSAQVAAVAQLALERGILLISDEIYRQFCYDGPFHSAAEFNPEALIIDGFSKAYGMTGWRLGFAHGPKALLEEMTMLHQITYVCAPSMVQHAGVAAFDVDTGPSVRTFARRRNRILEALNGAYEIEKPGGAFYVFPKAPWGTATQFVEAAIAKNLLIVPGSAFSSRDTHFRLSYAVNDEILDRGLEILRSLAKQGK